MAASLRLCIAAILWTRVGAEVSCVGPRLMARVQAQHKPLYHFSAPAQWMNDPVRVVSFRGQYHMFYQYNPCGSTWGNMSWGHAVSSDLVHWQDRPVALWPEDGEQGVFTGSVLINESDGEVTAFYTGAMQLPISWDIPYKAGMETVRTAKPTQTNSSDAGLALDSWHHTGTVIPGPPELEGFCVTGFRDPYLWSNNLQDGQPTLMLLSGGLRAKVDGKCEGTFRGGAVFLYQLHGDEWRHAGILHREAQSNMGKNWECANILQLGHSSSERTRAILTFGAQPMPNFENRSLLAVLGELDANNHFRREGEVVLDYGNLYAASAFKQSSNDGADNFGVMFGWSSEDRSEKSMLLSGWSGLLSLPRHVSASGPRGVTVQPAPVVDRLHGKKFQLYASEAESRVEPSDPTALLNAAYDLQTTINCTQNRKVTLSILRSADGREHTDLVLDCEHRRFAVKREASSSACGADVFCTNRKPMEIDIPQNGLLDMRVLADVSVLEIFMAGAVWTERVYPTLQAARHIQITTEARSKYEPFSLMLYEMQDAFESSPREQQRETANLRGRKLLQV
eukprot:TRINITY_DN48609_c0_g1_i1.p1 TRINITY_DN48609_c0_g1~~TRINITY_DN48609_c0_g1_i1.p1  ORF type:complete len:566 (+),score=67.29 TRINITY_DN48609_c0_g1_i1:76-1773(+)